MTSLGRILLLEDNPQDAELLQLALKSAGHTYEIVRVETEAAFLAALDSPVDLIISDYTLPSFDGKTALKVARERRPDVPFIFVSGTIGEEVAIDSLLSGATDYVFKHKFARFVPAVRRALHEAEERKARHEAEQALRSSEERYRELFEKSRDTIFISSSEGALIDMNPAGLKMFGFQSKEEALQANISRDLYWNPVRWNQIRWDLWNLGYVEDVEVELKRQDGTKLVALESTTLVSSGNGQVQVCHGTWRDVTTQRDLETQFLRVQRMESLGSLAGGIAHDLNNVLAPILMGIQMLLEKHEDEVTRRYLGTMEGEAKRGANLVRQILMFSRGVEGRRVTLHLQELIAGIEKMLQQIFPKSIAIVTNVAPDLWTVTGDKTQLEQVLMNLCLNARDAMPNGGVLSIMATNQILDPGRAGSAGEKHEPHVVIEVSDTGQGIPAEHLGRIFDPFFTTKKIGAGTGLGLSTVSAILTSHGGFISIDSIVEQGTTFNVYLPAMGTVREEKGITRAVSSFPMGNGELILVVDDEAAIRDMVRTILENYGYRVVVAADGIEAVAAYSKHRDIIRLVLTDLEMPRRSGMELIRDLEQVNPAVQVVSVSGLIDGDRLEQFVAHPIRAVLQKPFTPAELLKTLHDVLQR